jgi:peptidoglycan/LPS O-acetylase OafA/YrhL
MTDRVETLRPSSTSTATRLFALDGLRGLAALMIVVHHYGPSVIVAGIGEPLAYVNRALGLAWSGVTLFFVLSGFLIGGLLMDNVAAPNYYRIFYLRRACRILPAYALLLVLFGAINATGLAAHHSLTLGWFIYQPLPVWSFFTFMQNFFMVKVDQFGAGALGPTWSLALEEQFYLLLPLFIRRVPRRWWPAFFFGALIGSPLLRWWMPGMSAYVLLPMRADSFALGVGLAWLWRRPAARLALHRQRAWLWGLFIVLLAAGGVMTKFGLNMRCLLLPDSTLLHSLLNLFYSCAIWLALTEPTSLLARLCCWRGLRACGRWSYALYLFHGFINGLLQGLFLHQQPRLSNMIELMVTLFALVGTIAFSALVWRVLERPCVEFGHRFRYARPARPTS